MPALAEVRAQGQTLETPYGRAPITFADIVEKVRPSVVSILVAAGGPKAGGKGKGERGLPEGFPDIPEDSPFYDFFKNLPKEFRGQPQERPMQGQGSGFVISSDGYVVTNNHVVEGASKIQVSFGEKEKLDAELVGTDPRTDVALLKIKSAKPFPAVKFADKPVRVGDWVLAVGNPFGLGGTVTAGIVSAMARDINNGPYDFIQIDAAVNKGNSGGPTFNLDGEVIGVNTAIFSPSGGNVGIAFAVPARTALDVVEQLKKSGSVSRGWLGVKIQNVDDDTAAALGLPAAKGALVSEVTVGGPAASSGVRVQDAIIAVNDSKIEDSKDLARKIADFAPDTSVDVKVWRGNGEQTLKVKLGKFPGSSEEIAKLEQGETPPEADESMSLAELGLKLAPGRGGAKEEGVAIAEVDPDSDAYEKGIKAGDVILEVDRQPVTAPGDVMAGVKKVQERGLKAVMLHIKSADQKKIVSLKFGKDG
jgi:serine protease Do